MGPNEGRRAPGRLAVSAAAVVICSALALSAAARHAGPLPGDRAMATGAQRFPGWLEQPLEGLQRATATESVLVVGALIVAFLALRGSRGRAMLFAGVLVVLPMLQGGLKQAVDRPRPAADVVEHRVGFSSPSFPSGHVFGGTVVLALAASVPGRRGWAAAGAGVTAAVNGFAGVYLGAHWPSDVVGGYLWAAVLLLAAAGVAAARERRTRGGPQ